TADLAERRRRDGKAVKQDWPDGEIDGTPVSVLPAAVEGDRDPDRSERVVPARVVPLPATGAQLQSSSSGSEPAASQGGLLVEEQEASNFRQRWDTIQGNFVDEPRRAVEDADNLVATTIQRLADQFSQERSKLEHQWDRGSDVSTEDLRVALQRYRS